MLLLRRLEPAWSAPLPSARVPSSIASGLGLVRFELWLPCRGLLRRLEPRCESYGSLLNCFKIALDFVEIRGRPCRSPASSCSFCCLTTSILFSASRLNLSWSLKNYVSDLVGVFPSSYTLSLPVDALLPPLCRDFPALGWNLRSRAAFESSLSLTWASLCLLLPSCAACLSKNCLSLSGLIYSTGPTVSNPVLASTTTC